MNTQILHAEIKPFGTVYMYWMIFGIHYAYFGKWGLQLLYWGTLGGLGIWAVIDFMTMPEKIVKHREVIFRRKDEMEKYRKLTMHEQTRFQPGIGLNLSLVS
jgi:hypothetical protein